MIKDCFRNTNEFFSYDIKHNDVVIAKAHSLSIIDKTYIFRGENSDIVEMIIRALDNWEFDMPITKANINLLKDEYQLALINQITEHENIVVTEAVEIEKN
jgi:hypothetical protein